MVQVKASEAIQSVIGTLKGRERAEVLDDRGEVIAYLIPVDSPEEQLRRKAFAEYDPEKARRRRESREGGFTTEQVLVYLKSLDIG
jgi:hypothetical protein